MALSLSKKILDFFFPVVPEELSVFKILCLGTLKSSYSLKSLIGKKGISSILLKKRFLFVKSIIFLYSEDFK